ncbi:hypothetical protein PC121_g20156 [Phytophthora cactorum]|nr:hypothetical protein PC120_g19863 [Phytophthora cactorum]KAG3047276.1 hypothetical protein PC121_g20156 [Phytophthora cactorum]KAG4044123.1 hypothetical protein PC123_g20422 [Phytophthora cactorum]
MKELLPKLAYAQLLTLCGQPFKNVSRFTATSLNGDTAALDVALAVLLTHLDAIAAAVTREKEATGFTCHYLYLYDETLDANAALGAHWLDKTCANWGRELRTAWETDNFAQLGQRSAGNTAVLAAAVVQILASMTSMKYTLQKLVAMQ